MAVSFTTTKTDAATIAKIADRAVAELEINDRMAMRLDLTACHANGCELKLVELLAADPADFSHDIYGIRRHLNRKTGQLEDCFLPRFSA